MEKLREHAIFEVRKFPTRKHPARVHRKAALRLLASPVGRDGRDDHAVAGSKIPHEASDLYDLTHGLVA